MAKKLSEIERSLYESHLQTKETLIDVIRDMIDVIKVVNKIQNRVQKLEEKNG
ncbi:MAG: hypothetical protein Unbinned202contig1002_36 [Prokaryotic dsDNA virus sp.]|nr:MAG: hypothetical protein Unbinned202contig1002_36 [Prokaryotic dsDNA virus sp.]|tara:strand:+ start:15830 stop:15988 length:159 start_codon:yes stop_codon:yes gene_type:complete